MAWDWKDPSTWFQGDPPPATPPFRAYPGAGQGPLAAKPEQTPEQAAQGVITRYWQWQAAGARTVDVKDPSTGKSFPQAIDPGTGQADPDFPTTADITAAESLLTRKQTNDPAAVQAAKDQAAATLQETLTRTRQIQATLDAGKNPPPLRTVQPGEGVVGPDGTVSVPLPKPTTPAKTQTQIDQEAADVHAAAQRTAANSQTPAQALSSRLTEIRATANAQHDAAMAEWQQKVDAGYIMKPADEANLKAQLDQIAADAAAQRAKEQAQFTHDLDQPNVDRTAGIAQQNATSQDQARQDQAAQADRNQQADAYKAQAAQADSFLTQLIKGGVDPSMTSVRATTDPLWLALHLAHQEVAKGTIPASAIPTPGAPKPAADNSPPSAPVPAPGIQPPPDYAAASVNDPARAY